MIIDGMDKKKYLLPRWKWGRTPKDAEHLHRPCLELTAVICHGHGTYLFLSDQDISNGSSWHAELVIRTLSLVHERSQRRGQSMPDALSVHSDNTTSGLKNSICAGVLCMLCAGGYFRTTSLQHLRVGHSHEDIDALFGVIASILATADELETPQEIIECRPAVLVCTHVLCVICLRVAG